MRSSWSVLHAEVQVEPVGQLDLEAHPDGIVPLFTGNVQDETAGDTEEGRVRTGSTQQTLRFNVMSTDITAREATSLLHILTCHLVATYIYPSATMATTATLSTQSHLRTLTVHKDEQYLPSLNASASHQITN